jgi:hypothetical protein
MGAFSLAACGAAINTNAADSGDAEGSAAEHPDAGDAGGFGDGGHTPASDSGHTSSDGGPGHGDAGRDSSGTGGEPVDAGYYYGDGSFWVDGGAYHDLPDGSSHGGTDAASFDASSGCGALAACCATLTGSTQALCTTIASLGDATNCATELSMLQGEGDCTGVTIVASGIEEPASRLVSDGTLLFWTDFLESAGLLAVPVGGGEITTVLTGIVQLVDVDDTNIYVLTSGTLDSFGVGDINTYAMEDSSFVRVPKSGAPATRISGGGAVWAATTLAGTAYWIEVESSSVTVQSAPMKGGAASTVATLSSSAMAGVYDGTAQIGVTQDTVFIGAFSSVEYFSIGGGSAVSSGPSTFCQSFASDTNAVYCDVGTGSNLTLASDGAASTLGAVVNPSGADPFPYIVSDATYAYWANNAMAGTIVKAPKAGGGSTTVIARDANPTAIAIDTSSVYWADQGGYIKSIPR